MNALLLAALLALSPSASASSAAPTETDLRCFRLMAELSRERDPEVRALGLTAANFFLGRIDAAAPGFDVRADSAGAPPGDVERPALVRRCSEALSAGGFDLGALRRSLVQPLPAI